METEIKQKKKNVHAVALGKRNKGKTRIYTDEERDARRQRLVLARARLAEIRKEARDVKAKGVIAGSDVGVCEGDQE